MADPPDVFKPFNYGIISEELKKAAESELNEKQGDKHQVVKKLRDLLKRERGFNPCLEDDFLVMFLRARKFNIESAYNLVKKYYSSRKEYPSMFRNFTPVSCVKVMRANIHYFLPHRTPDGCPVLLSKFGKWDPRVTTCEDLLKFNLICNEMAIQNPVTQITGVIVIADMKDFSWTHLFHIPISDVKCFVNTLQDCLPVRHKATHIIHNSSIFSILFSLVKPLLNEKITKRIFFHGDDIHSLHQHISPEMLPKDLGGKLNSMPNEDFNNALLDSEEDFISRQKFGYSSMC